MVSTPLKQRLAVVLSALPLVVAGADEAIPQGVVGPAAGIMCSAAVVPASAATQTIVVAGSAGTTISVCGWVFSAGTGTGTISFSYSPAASACTTNTTVISSTMSVPANSTTVFHEPYAVISIPQGYSLCALPSSTLIKYTVFTGQN